MVLRAHQRRLYNVSQESSSSSHFEGLDSVGNTWVTPFGNVTVAFSSLPKATGIEGDMGSAHTDKSQ